MKGYLLTWAFVLGALAIAPVESEASPADNITGTAIVGAAEGTVSVEVIGAKDWTLGTVPMGGCKDTWHDNGGPGVDGPGAFAVKNTGALADLWVAVFPYQIGGTPMPTATFPTADKFALAFALNVTENTPDWKLCEYVVPWLGTNGLSRLMRSNLATGEIVYFDLKYWSPQFDTAGNTNKFDVSINVVAPSP